MSKSETKVAKTFRLDRSTVEALEKRAKEENRTLSNLVDTILKGAGMPRPFVSVDEIKRATLRYSTDEQLGIL